MVSPMVCQVAQLIDAGEFFLASTVARQFLQDEPDDGALWQILGLAHYRQGNTDEALGALETASVYIPLDLRAQFALASCYLQKQKFALARLMFRHLGRKAHDSDLLSATAAKLGSFQQDEAALAVCRRITLLHPAHHQAHFGVAFYLARLGAKPETMLPPLALAHDLAPEVTQYAVNLAFLWAKLDRHELAHTVLKSISMEDISCPCWIQRMQSIFERAGDALSVMMCKARLSCLLQ